MAIEIVDGFDTYTIAQMPRRYPSINTTSMSMVAGYAGVGQGLKIDQNYNAYIPYYVTARSSYYIGFHFKSSGSFNNNQGGVEHWLRVVNASNTELFTLQGTYGGGGGNGPIYVSVMGGSAITCANVLSGNWSQIACFIKADPTVGELEVRVDGATVYHGTGLNTGSALINQIFLVGCYIGGGWNTQVYFDNFWVLNTLGTHSNTFPVGPVIIQPLSPAADGTYQDWSPSTGSTHYTTVDETTSNDDTDYVYAAVPAARDSYGIQSVSDVSTGVVNVIHGVQLSAVAEKENVPPQKLRLIAKSGSSVVTSPDPGTNNVLMYYTTYFPYILDDDPATAGQWTKTGINAMEIGQVIALPTVQAQTGVSRIRVTTTQTQRGTANIA
jgi:hypothetical protein